MEITIIDDEYGISDKMKKVLSKFPDGTELSILEVLDLIDELEKTYENTQNQEG